MTEASIALYVSAASLTVSACALTVAVISLRIAVMSIRSSKTESDRNDAQDKLLEGFQGWTANMQRTTEDNNKQMGRIISHLVSERDTRSRFSDQTYIILDAISEKVGIDPVQRKKWQGSTLPILQAMREDAEK